jgi:hypothetical protein
LTLLPKICRGSGGQNMRYAVSSSLGW